MNTALGTTETDGNATPGTPNMERVTSHLSTTSFISTDVSLLL